MQVWRRHLGGRTVGLVAAVALVGLSGAGCVRRTLTVNTEPQGAILWLNGEEIGRTPVTVDFLWYGDYEVTARMPGFQTLQTHHELKAPWYQTPGIDFFSEVLYPGHIVDVRTADFTLSPEQLPGNEQLLDNAAELRTRATVATAASRAAAPAAAPDAGPAEPGATPTVETDESPSAEPGATPQVEPGAAPQVEPMTAPPASPSTSKPTAPSTARPPASSGSRPTEPAPAPAQDEEMAPAPDHPEVEETAAPPPRPMTPVQR